MSKGDRANLERLLRSTWERQRQNDLPASASMPHPANVHHAPTKERRSLWDLWEVFAVTIGAILALEATSVWPLLYWPGVLIVYLGFAGIVFDGLRGRWHQHWLSRSAIAVVGIIGLACWTIGFVLAKADMTATSLASPGDMRLYLINSTDYDFDHLHITLSSDNMISRITQLEPACQDFNFFSGAPPVSAQLRDNDTGKTLQSLPSGPSLSNRMHLVCGELPRHSTATFAIALIATDIGKDPKNLLPKQFSAPKRLPEWCSIDGDYRAVGKARHTHFRWTY